MVTPTYYVYFTSTTIITSSVLFQGFKGTPTSIVTVVNGFLTICSGVVLLQLSKSAKDVPDVAVFKGDLDQIQTIAEQEQPETEPKADAIRGAAAIVRRFSVARQKMEMEEFKRLHEEKQRERLEPLTEDGQNEYEWDGLRRRRTVYGSQRSRANTTPNPFQDPALQQHPPLGWSHIPTEEELAAQNQPASPGILSSIAGTIRARARSSVLPGHPDFAQDNKVQSPMHPVQLTEINMPQAQKATLASGSGGSSYFGGYSGLQAQKTEYEGGGGVAGERHIQIVDDGRTGSQGSSIYATGPTPPPHSARRQFSFQNVFRRGQQDATRTGSDISQEPPEGSGSGGGAGARPGASRPRATSRNFSSPLVKGATEEERLGLVKGDSQSMPALPSYDEYDEPDPYTDDEAKRATRYGRGITSPVASRRGSDDDKTSASPPGGVGIRTPPRGASDRDLAEYEAQRRRFNDSRQAVASSSSGSRATPTPPPHAERKHSPPRGGGDPAAFI